MGTREFTPQFNQHAPGLVTGYVAQPQGESECFKSRSTLTANGTDGLTANTTAAASAMPSVPPEKLASVDGKLASSRWQSDDGSLRLFLGDCRLLLPQIADASIDLVATDPPYGISYETNRRTVSDAPPAIENDDRPPLDIVYELARVTKDGGAVYLFTRDDVADQWRAAMKDAGLKLKTTIVWDKTNHTAGDLNGDYGSQVELILFAHKGRHLLRDGRDTNLWRQARPLPGIHPTPKPVELLRRIVRNSSDPGQLVLDPFMGTGSTGAACARLCRRFIGMEIHAPYFEHARQWMTDEQLRHPLFEPPPVQGEMFATTD